MSRALNVVTQRDAGERLVRLLPFSARTFLRPQGRADSASDEVTHGQTEDLAAHRARFGPRPDAAGEAGLALLGMLEETGLSGHGGGHFPVARKWRTALRSGRFGGLLVANGAEGEPESGKDRVLLHTVPHLVFDGLACAAETLGMTEAVLWLHQGADGLPRMLRDAIRERRVEGLADPDIRIALAPTRYLSGESSAALRALSGGPAMPSFRRIPAAIDGYRGQRAVVHNVETLARIGLLARTGVRGHRPSALVTVNTRYEQTVLELAVTATIGEAVASGGWTQPPPQAVLVGGYGGTWLPWPLAARLRLDEKELQAAGASLGAGVLSPLAAYECGIVRAAEIADFLAEEGAGQCGPCRYGLPAIAKGLTALAGGRADAGQLQELQALTTLVDGRGACHHPDGAARQVRSALHTFASDAARHSKGLPCAASTVAIGSVS